MSDQINRSSSRPPSRYPSYQSPQDAFKVRLNRILEVGLEWHEWLWFGPREDVREFLKNQPEEARYKFASFSKFFDRAMPVRVLHASQKTGVVSPDTIDKMGLTPEALRKLAGIKDDGELVGVEEAEVVEQSDDVSRETEELEDVDVSDEP